LEKRARFKPFVARSECLSPVAGPIADQMIRKYPGCWADLDDFDDVIPGFHEGATSRLPAVRDGAVPPFEPEAHPEFHSDAGRDGQA